MFQVSLYRGFGVPGYPADLPDGQAGVSLENLAHLANFSSILAAFMRRVGLLAALLRFSFPVPPIFSSGPMIVASSRCYSGTMINCRMIVSLL